MEGTLSKWTNVMKGWQIRWFVLDERAGLFSYYTSKEKMMRNTRRGCVRLKGAIIGIDDEDETLFTITVDGKTFHLQARDGDERDCWIRALENAISLLTHNSHRIKRWDPHQPLPTMADFDRQLVESDAYLQLMIQQAQALEFRLSWLVWRLRPVRAGLTPRVRGCVPQRTRTPRARWRDAEVKTGVEFGAEVREDEQSGARSDQLGEPAIGRFVQEVPETSYSSSEDEDWFDTEDAASSHQQAPSPGAAVSSADYDAAYEEEEDDLGSMEGHGSVVSHLLSQLRIGMDLTRVVLPTFILERRSLLEMYADFFAHPDLFTSIPDCPTPRDRLVQVLKWYLSAFHAGRKSEVAKKPYNPIIGETFRCVFDIPGQPASETDSLVPDGPVPWGSEHQVCFVAEQVSHHPPVSAFYAAEHYGRRVSFCGHIWTKSKFLGLSIGVHNIGQGCVSLLDLDEEYLLSFPSGYGRYALFGAARELRPAREA
ncbi:oxysterol-binding protein-related protein 9-like [Pollicipes pollicipes]|uniref:oxysterol-binding protein-related protein 9-like n=1 Tax=Pollicipes pollicipes TaxID=41117 RepID=UPI00188585B0|nr:oxysterol-binding protein-related protein 9-like [Pollicipes pollicipes]